MSGKKTVKSTDFAQYLAEAGSWDSNMIQREQASRKLAWRITTGALVLAGLGVAGTLTMALQPPPPPTVLRVDNATGIVDLLSTIKDVKEDYGEAVDKYFTQRYVIYRESYGRNLLTEYYNNVGLMSATGEQQRYYDAINPKNPQSPINVYGDYVRVHVTIKSTSFIKPGIALVRYQKEVSRGTEQPSITHWAATVTFRYSKLPMSEKDRAVNPLGFQVMDYRDDADTTESSASISAPAPVISPASQQPAPTVLPTILPASQAQGAEQ